MTFAGPGDTRTPALEIVPLGGLGEFGMNMMAVSWGDTLVVVDAGVMFPDPELLGVDMVIPDLSYLEQRGPAAALVLTHGHEDHIGAVAHVLRHVGGPDLRHAADAGAGQGEARAPRDRRGQPADAGAAANARGRRGPLDRVPPRHAQHPRRGGAGGHDAGGNGHPHRRLQDRPDAARRRALRLPPVRRTRRPGSPGAAGRQHEHRAPGVHGLRVRGRGRVRGTVREHPRKAGRHGVCDEHLPDADPGEPGEGIRAQGRIRRARR